MKNFPYRFPHRPRLLLFLLLLFPTFSWGYQTVNGTFTDSENRTAKFRYFLQDNHDTSSPTGIYVYFHGNNSGTQDEVLDMFSSIIRSIGFRHQLVPVLIASPETRMGGGGEQVRQWYDEDMVLVHDLIQSRFNGGFTVDFNNVIFHGSSQGTCFLNRLIVVHGENYRGGAISDCGCFNNPDYGWEPPQAMLDDFRIFVRATTEDFLYAPSNNAYDFFKYINGFDVRGDLQTAGGHCQSSIDPGEQIVGWVVGDGTLPEEPFQPHWRRLQARDGIDALTAGPGGTLYIAEFSDTQDTIEIFASNDGGRSFSPRATISSSSFLDMESDIDGNLLVTAFNNSFVSTNGGQSFANYPGGHLRYLQRIGNYIVGYSSGTVGYIQRVSESWNTVNVNASGDHIGPDHNFGLVDPQNFNIIITETHQISFNASTRAISATPLNLPATGFSYDAAANGSRRLMIIQANNEFGTDLEFYFSSNAGANWSLIPIPAVGELDMFTRSSYLSGIYLPDGDLYVYGNWDSYSFKTTNNTQTWTPARAMSGLGRGQDAPALMAADDLGNVYASNDDGLFLYVAEENSGAIFQDGFESN